MKLIPVTYYGFTAMDRRFSSPMLPWIVSEIRKRDYNEKLSVGIEDGILQAYNPDFELQFSHKVNQVTRFSQADQDPTTFLYLMRDDSDALFYCYLFQAKKKDDVMHVIDAVLDPVMLHQWPRPNALDFVAHSSNWAISKSSTAHFHNKIVYHKLTSLFERNGGHTFFVPIDEKLDAFRLEHIDKYVVRAHVIENQVLFTRPVQKQFIYETAANGDYIYVVISFEHAHNKYFVRSHTVLGDSNHKKGDLLVEIVKSDIPVKNGVVHLIQRPLGVFDRELKPFPYLSVYYKMAADPQLNITYNLGNANGVNELLKSGGRKRFTYFAPRDQAWKRVEKMSESVLNRHLIHETNSFSMKHLMEMQTSVNLLRLSAVGGVVEVRVALRDGVYFVEWRGREIRIVRPDYECSDGVVHVIDGVFSEDEQEVVQSDGEGGFSFWKMLKTTFT